MGLREQIKNASSESEISALLTKGNSFEFASEYTKRSWKSAAKFRLALLNSNDSAQTSEKEVIAKKNQKKKKDKVA